MTAEVDVPFAVIEPGAAAIVEADGSAGAETTVRRGGVGLCRRRSPSPCASRSTVAVHEAPVHEPSGVIPKPVPPVTSPSELLNASNASTV